jgi:EpsI family protein
MTTKADPVPHSGFAEVPFDLSRRHVLFGGAMLATSAVATVMTPRARETALPPGGLEQAIPKALGPWTFVSASGLVLPPPDTTEKRTYDQVLTRSYAHPDGGPRVMLLIAYGGGQTGVLTVHRPEACYPAQGYAMSGREIVPVPIRPGQTVDSVFWSASSDVRREQLLYWTRIDRSFPKSWAEEHVAVIRSNMMRRLPDGVLVRMSIISGEAEPSIKRLERFAADMVAHVGPAGRRILLG